MRQARDSLRLIFLLLLSAGVAICAAAHPAVAQIAEESGTSGPGDAGLPHAGSSVDKGPQPGDPPQQPPPGDDAAGKDAPLPPPPALPGSHAQPTEAAPADKVVADMDPTAALFDAINRGDAGAARDAVSRGANLDGTNVLGLTPIELAVDLDRNDISFLLLSMHGAASEAGRPPAAVRRVASVSTHRHDERIDPLPAAAAGVGAPAPAAGFLGFGKGGS